MATVTGEVDAFGHVRLGGIGEQAGRGDRGAHRLRDARTTILGHVQRGGTPTRVRPGAGHPVRAAAIDAVHDGAFGTMVALRGPSIVRVPLAEAVGELKTVPPERYEEAEVFFG